MPASIYNLVLLWEKEFKNSLSLEEKFKFYLKKHAENYKDARDHLKKDFFQNIGTKLNWDLIRYDEKKKNPENNFSNTPMDLLLWMAEYHDIDDEVLMELATQGNYDYCTPNKNGYNSLMNTLYLANYYQYDAWNRYPNYLQFLIDQTTNVNERSLDKGNTALIYPVIGITRFSDQSGWLIILKKLMEKGGDPNILSYDGNTPLNLAKGILVNKKKKNEWFGRFWFTKPLPNLMALHIMNP